MAAAELLVAGYDSPALRESAGRGRRDDIEELATLLRQALGELGVAMPDAATAERCLLHHLAARLRAGELSAGAVAGRVWCGEFWADVRTAPERAFLDAVGEEYLVEHLAEYRPAEYRAWEDGVRAAARVLADSAG
ncbi:hypothetical protein OG535_10955 [Kitasatospora sp. NBC_00085]|uniref:hypothetical protein n=1 Tax=unclassified Kitasatospora TaxID=2633591 RepID=UPI003252D0FA